MNHATLAGHTFTHELQVAADAGLLGSMDANRGDYQNGWDTDQFPNNINELTEAMLVILEAGGFEGGGINFDAKIRRNSTDLKIFSCTYRRYGYIRPSLVIADNILQHGEYRKIREDRYASFSTGKGKEFTEGKLSTAGSREFAIANGEPQAKSGRRNILKILSTGLFKPVSRKEIHKEQRSKTSLPLCSFVIFA